jgi:hypothetical protein
MKKTIIVFLSILALNVFVCTSAKAQEDEKETLYNFAYTYPDTRFDNPKTVYVSPVVECEFDADEWSHHLRNNLDSRWEEKVRVNFDLDGMLMVYDAWLWRDRGDVEEERDETIIQFKNEGYQVYHWYYFSFYYECDPFSDD